MTQPNPIRTHASDAAALRSDAQCRNLAVLKRKVMAELDRTAGERSADLSDGDCLSARNLKTRHVSAKRMVFGDSAVDPCLDRIPTMLAVFICNDRICREEFQERIRLARVLGLEIAENRSR